MQCHWPCHPSTSLLVHSVFDQLIQSTRGDFLLDSVGLQRMTSEIQEGKDRSSGLGGLVMKSDPCAEVTAAESTPREAGLEDLMEITGSLNSRAHFQVSLTLGAKENSLIPSISFCKWYVPCLIFAPLLILAPM